MAFLFQDQNQGIRNEESRTPKRISQGARVAATVLFHPDFNRRPRICTESADPSPLEGRRSRAWAHRPYRRWGLSPHPEKIGRLGMSRPAGKYDERSALQQAAWPGNFSWSPCREREPFLMPRTLPPDAGSRSLSALRGKRGALPASGARQVAIESKIPLRQKLTTSYRHYSDSG